MTFAQMVTREFIGTDHLPEDREPFDKAKALFLVKGALAHRRAMSLKIELSGAEGLASENDSLATITSGEASAVLKSAKAVLAASRTPN